mmetsp:Transcript_22974/g.42924  ORF Transcript_22974/g.42924 Transcript_22974/m.42924 type:complete len:291 (-) Transcript_22974:1126-1998(-)
MVRSLAACSRDYAALKLPCYSGHSSLGCFVPSAVITASLVCATCLVIATSFVRPSSLVRATRPVVATGLFGSPRSVIPATPFSGISSFKVSTSCLVVSRPVSRVRCALVCGVRGPVVTPSILCPVVPTSLIRPPTSRGVIGLSALWLLRLCHPKHWDFGGQNRALDSSSQLWHEGEVCWKRYIIVSLHRLWCRRLNSRTSRGGIASPHAYKCRRHPVHKTRLRQRCRCRCWRRRRRTSGLLRFTRRKRWRWPTESCGERTTYRGKESSWFGVGQRLWSYQVSDDIFRDSG